jgi:hypothetical protein
MQVALSFSEVKKHLEPDRTKDNVIQDSALYSLVEKLVSQYAPSERDEYDTKWFDFYLPTKRKGKLICMPFGVVKLISSVQRKKEEYFLDFPGEDNGFFSIVRGRGKADETYYNLVQSAMDFPFLTNRNELDKLVPYEFRTGKIKRKHIEAENEELWSKEECNQVLHEYAEHAQNLQEAKPVSLNGYLRVAAIGYRAVFPDKKGLSPFELYEKHNFRHAGMLDMKDPDSVEEFNAWLKSREWGGSHPFELVMSGSGYGVELDPPRAFFQNKSTFILSVGNDYYNKTYITMLRAMMKEKAAVLTLEPPMLSDALNFLSGESYFTVHLSSRNEFDYYGTRDEKKQYFKHIEWDDLKILKRA